MPGVRAESGADNARQYGTVGVIRQWRGALGGCAAVVMVAWWIGTVAAQVPASRVFLPFVARGFTEHALLVNGDFEAGPQGWEPSCDCVTSAGPPGGWRSGRLGARIGGPQGQRVAQTIAVPRDHAGLRFGFWYKYLTGAPDAFLLSDRVTVTVRDEINGELAFLTQVAARDGLTAEWVRESADLTAWQGRRLVVTFEALSPGGQTWLYLDDVELIAGASALEPLPPAVTGRLPAATATPLPTPKPSPTPTPTPLGAVP